MILRLNIEITNMPFAITNIGNLFITIMNVSVFFIKRHYIYYQTIIFKSPSAVNMGLQIKIPIRYVK